MLSNYSDKAEMIYSNSMRSYRRKHVSADDILDSICLAVTLGEMVNAGSPFETDNLDILGIPMKIHYFTK